MPTRIMFTSSTSDRMISQIFDPAGDVPILYGFVDVVEARVLQIGLNSLQFEMRVVSPPPINPGQYKVVYQWIIDADRNYNTGEKHSFTGSEFNLRVIFEDGRWRGNFDWLGHYRSWPSVFIDDNLISTIIDRSQIGDVQSFNWEIETFYQDPSSTLAADVLSSLATATIPSSPPNPGVISEVTILPSSLKLSNGVTSSQVFLVAKDAVGKYISSVLTIKFFVDHPGMISLTDNGRVEALNQKLGFGWITAKIDGVVSQNHVEVKVGSIMLLPPILLLSVLDNSTGNVRVQIRDAAGNDVAPNTVHFYSSNPNVATVSDSGLVTAIESPHVFSDTPYIRANADGVWANNDAIVRVTNKSLGLTLDGLWGKHVAFFMPQEPVTGFDYRKILTEHDVVRIADTVYEAQSYLTGVDPFNGDLQFLVNDPGHGSDGTVPCGISGNPIRLGTDVDKPIHNSCFIVAYGSGEPQWGVYFHEMGHNFLGMGAKFVQFYGSKDPGYAEAFASISAMYAAKMLEKYSSDLRIPQDILNEILPIYHFGTTPDLDEYLRSGADYTKVSVEVIYDVINALSSRYGWDLLYRFFSVFLPVDKPFTFTVDSSAKQATLFVAALSSGTRVDLRTQFREWGFPIDDEYYENIRNEVNSLVNQRPDITALLNFTHSPHTPYVHETVTFDASANFNPYGSVVNYIWNFGDGNITTTIYPAIDHVYTISGAYNVTLTVTDEFGLTNSASASLTVFQDNIPPFTLDDYDGVWHTTDLIITLKATDNESGVSETCYRINKGLIQNVSTTGQPLMTLESANNTLEYWSIDKAGNEETPHKILTGIKIDKTAPTDSIAIADGTTYRNSTSVILTLYAEDATSGVAQMRFSHDNITWTPWEPYSISKSWTLTTGDGTKIVYVQFMNNAGLVSPTYQDTIILDATKPIAIAVVEHRIVTVGTTIAFGAEGSWDNMGIVSYKWNYGDGTTGTGVTTTHTYANPGTYIVTLTVEDAASNSASHSATVTVRSPETFPTWIVGTAIATLGIVVGATILEKRMKGQAGSRPPCGAPAEP